MADAGKNAITTYTQIGGGGVDFLVAFPYLEREHVIVELDAGGAGSFVVQARPADYDFTTDGTEIVFVVTPSAGDVVRITRETPHPAGSLTSSWMLVQLEDGVPVTAEDLETLHKQSIYYTEEVEDLI